MTEKVVIELTLEQKQALDGLAKLNKGIKKTEKNVSGLTVAVGAFAGILASKAISAGFTAISSGISKIASSTQELETIQNQFVTLTGSVGAAQEAIEGLQKFTATTPLQLPRGTNTAQKLISVGFELDEIVPILGELGDAAAASGSDLGELGLIFRQIKASS